MLGESPLVGLRQNLSKQVKDFRIAVLGGGQVFWPQEAEKWSNGRCQMRVVASRMDFQQHCMRTHGSNSVEKIVQRSNGALLDPCPWDDKIVEFSAHVEGEL